MPVSCCKASRLFQLSEKLRTLWVRVNGTGQMNDLGRHLRLQSESKGPILAVAAVVTLLCAWVTLVAQSNASHRLITNSAGTVASSSVQRTMFTNAEYTRSASTIANMREHVDETLHMSYHWLTCAFCTCALPGLPTRKSVKGVSAWRILFA